MASKSIRGANRVIGYETTFILRPDIADDNQKTLVEKLKSIIAAHGGQVVAMEDWGRRRLAYPIQKETRGYYTYLLYTGNNDLVAELERNLRITESAIRFLTVKLGDDFDAANHKRKPTPNIAATATLTAPGAAAAPAAIQE